MRRRPGKYNFYYDTIGALYRNGSNCRYGHGVSYTICEKDAPGPDRFCGYNSVPLEVIWLCAGCHHAI